MGASLWYFSEPTENATWAGGFIIQLIHHLEMWNADL